MSFLENRQESNEQFLQLEKRPRLISFNSPYISPMQFPSSPILNTQFNQQFQLEPAKSQKNDNQNDRYQQQIGQSLKQQKINLPQIISINQNNIMIYLLQNISIDQEILSEIKIKIQQSNKTFLLAIFQYLYKKFKSLRKTKQQMIKYCIRKAFKFLAQKLKKSYPNYSNDSNDYIMLYFSEHKQINIPFKQAQKLFHRKNSFEKTMNATFLQKIFQSEKFVADYKEFLCNVLIILETFIEQCRKDNKKKIEAMNQAVSQCFQAKSLKVLDGYKRLPWTQQLLCKIQNFAKSLLSYSKKQNFKEEMAACKFQLDKNCSEIDVSLSVKRSKRNKSEITSPKTETLSINLSIN